MSLLNLMGLTPEKALSMTKGYMDKNGIAAILIENGEEVKTTSFNNDALQNLKNIALENEKLNARIEGLKAQVIRLTAEVRAMDNHANETAAKINNDGKL